MKEVAHRESAKPSQRPTHRGGFSAGADRRCLILQRRAYDLGGARDLPGRHPGSTRNLGSPRTSLSWVGSSTITALVDSFVVGGVIYLIGYRGGASVQEQAINVFIAIILCCFIAAGVLGVDELVEGSDNTPTSP
jgi:hypothetical protein